MIQNHTDWCHHRGQLREGSKGSEPSGSGRHEGEGVWGEMKGSLWYNPKLLFISGGKSCSTTNSMNITGLQWVDVLYCFRWVDYWLFSVSFLTWQLKLIEWLILNLWCCQAAMMLFELAWMLTKDTKDMLWCVPWALCCRMFFLESYRLRWEFSLQVGHHRADGPVGSWQNHTVRNFALFYFTEWDFCTYFVSIIYIYPLFL